MPNRYMVTPDEIKKLNPCPEQRPAPGSDRWPMPAAPGSPPEAAAWDASSRRPALPLDRTGTAQVTSPQAIAAYRLSRFTPEEAEWQLRAEILNAQQWSDGSRIPLLVQALDLILKQKDGA